MERQQIVAWAVSSTMALGLVACHPEESQLPTKHNLVVVPDRLNQPCPETPPSGVSEYTVAAYEAQATRTEEVLPKLDTLVTSLLAELQAKFAESPTYSKSEQAKLLAPLEFFIGNRKSHIERNFGKQRLAEICQPRQAILDTANSMPQVKDGPEYIACDYGFQDNSGFNDLSQRPLYNTLITACELNLLSAEDRLTVYGQLLRAVPDIALAQGNPYDTYAELMHESYVWLELETQVKATQLEMLDVLADGELEKAVKLGRSTNKIAGVIIKSMEAPYSEISDIKDTARLGKAYFDRKSTTRDFQNAVARQLTASGLSVVNVSPDGEVQLPSDK